jgi:hypothetical protein
VGLPGPGPGTSSLSALTQSGFPGWRQRPVERRPAGDRRGAVGSQRVWPNHGTGRSRSRGQRRSAWRTLAGKVDPRRLPPTSEPAWAIALLGGALAGSGPGTSPCIDGLSLVSGMVVPRHPAGSNHIQDGGLAWTRTPWEVGFEPSAGLLRRPRSRRSTASDLRCLFADVDRSARRGLSGSWCRADPARTSGRAHSGDVLVSDRFGGCRRRGSNPHARWAQRF